MHSVSTELFVEKKRIVIRYTSLSNWTEKEDSVEEHTFPTRIKLNNKCDIIVDYLGKIYFVSRTGLQVAKVEKIKMMIQVAKLAVVNENQVGNNILLISKDKIYGLSNVTMMDKYPEI